ncbi:hypothetical protein [Ursidibacter arcticus]|uniref:hypothetical protein n=1 Tax=Ursidibacter arcticus TaxID=1524965 RepID=UPI0012FA9676|nr:hypothetical protein [Ursidibacter arcticus]
MNSENNCNKSPFLKYFLDEIGKSVISINTIYVGLEGVSNRKVEKPDSLSIYWNPKDLKKASEDAKYYIFHSSLVYIQTLILSYFKSVNKISKIYKESSSDAKDKIKDIFIFVKEKDKSNELEVYWEKILILLVDWRNKIVHQKNDHKIDLDLFSEKECSKIKEKHANIDIKKTIQHYNANKITLKDITTIISISINSVRTIDKIIFSEVFSDINNLINFIEEENLKLLLRILSTSSVEKKLSKFNNFMQRNYRIKISPDKINLEILKQSISKKLAK